MRRTIMHRTLITTAVVSLFALAASDAIAQMRAPYGSGTGVSTLGLKTNNRVRQVPTFTIPQGGYGYRGYGYRRNYGYASPYGRLWYGARPRPVWLPPVWVDADYFYGPGFNRQFFFGSTVPQVSVPQVVVPNIVVNNNIAAAPLQQPQPAPAANPLPPAPKIDPLPNRENRHRAWRLIEAGDRNLREGDYRDALAHYRKSTVISKEMADGYFRTAFAMIALQRWTEATLTIERGLLRNPKWPTSGFVLEEVYGTAEAKRAAFRKVQIAKQESPNNSDVRFVLGVMLHFDGQQDAAEREFRRVIEITGRGNHARAFLAAAGANGEADKQVDEAPANNPEVPDFFAPDNIPMR